MSLIWFEKYINIWFGLYHRSIVKSVGKNPSKFSTFCSSYGPIYIDNRTIRGVNICQYNLYLLQSSYKVLFNNFISYLNSNFLKYPHPLQTWT